MALLKTRKTRPWRETWEGQAAGPHESWGFYLSQCFTQGDSAFLSSCPVKDSLWFLGHKGPMSSLHSLDHDLVTYERGPGCPAPCWPHCSLRPAKCFILCHLGLLMEGHLAIRLIWPGLMSTNCLGLRSGLQKLTGTVEAA